VGCRRIAAFFGGEYNLAKSNGRKAKSAWPLIRQLHVYISVFIAPSLLFFAFTGAFQTFRVPDNLASPVLLQKLARVHKDDVFAVKPPPKAKPPQAAGKPAEAKPPEKPKTKNPATERVKWFFVGVSILIMISTLFGLWMALAYSRRKLPIWILLIAGILAPVILLSM